MIGKLDNISENRRYRIFHVSLILLAILVYYGFVQFHSTNAPYSDDYNDILWTLVTYTESDNPTDKISTLIRQHNEHKTVVPRLIYLCQYLIFGKVNFANLIFLGNLAILGLYIGFLTQLGFNSYTHPVSIILAFTLFQAQAIQSMFWAMAAISNYYVLFFAMLSLALLSQKDDTRQVLLAGIIASLATFTQANGMLTFAAGTLYLMQRAFISKNASSSLQLLFWIVLSALATTAYLYNFQHTKATSSILTRITTEPLRLIAYYIKVTGAGFAQNNPNIAFLSGILLLGSFCLMIYKQFHIRRPGLFYYLVFILMSIFLITLSRTIWGDHQALAANRYRILSVNIWAISLIFYYDTYLQNINRKTLTISFCILLATIASFSYSYILSYPIVTRLQSTIVADLNRWMTHGKTVSTLLPSWAALYSTNVTRRAINYHIYSPDQLIFTRAEIKQVQTDACDGRRIPSTQVTIESTSPFNSYAQSITATLSPTVADVYDDNTLLILLCSDENDYEFRLDSGHKRRLSNQIELIFPKQNIASNIYNVRLLLTIEKEITLLDTGVEININGNAFFSFNDS